METKKNNNCVNRNSENITFKILEEIKLYESYKEEVFDNIRNAKNLSSERVIAWAKDLEISENKISTLEALLK